MVHDFGVRLPAAEFRHAVGLLEEALDRMAGAPGVARGRSDDGRRAVCLISPSPIHNPWRLNAQGAHGLIARLPRWALAAAAGPLRAGPTMDAIKATRHRLWCAAFTHVGLVGFLRARQVRQGYAGLTWDYCKALAAAILGSLTR
jgi:hypothetical protein